MALLYCPHRFKQCILLRLRGGHRIFARVSRCLDFSGALWSSSSQLSLGLDLLAHGGNGAHRFIRHSWHSGAQGQQAHYAVIAHRSSYSRACCRLGDSPAGLRTRFISAHSRQRTLRQLHSSLRYAAAAVDRRRCGGTRVTVVLLTRCRNVLNLWLTVVLWGQLLEVLLGFGGQARYSYGWYFSRLHGGASALIILIVFLRSMLKLRDKVLRLNLELRQQASEDALTGLANHRIFFEELRRAVARHNRTPTALTLLVLDVDHFKRYNDTYGHAQGNLCLQTIAELLRISARRPDDLVARIGGEEFAILLPDTRIEGARTIAANIIRKLDETRLEHEASAFRHVTISIGGAVCDAACRPSEKTLFEFADKALYKAKSEGRNRLELLRFNVDAEMSAAER